VHGNIESVLGLQRKFIQFLFAVVLILCSMVPVAIASQRLLDKHPLRIVRSLRKAIRAIVRKPERIFDIGLAPVPGDRGVYERAARHVFASSCLEDLRVYDMNPSQLPRGCVEKMTCVLSNLRIYPLHVSSIFLTFHGLEFDVEALMQDGAFRIHRLEGISFRIEVTQASLQSFVPKGHRVQVDVGRITFEGRTRLLLVSTVFRLSGRLAVVDKRKIVLRAGSLNVGNLPFVGILKDRVTRAFNPLFDTESYLGRATSLLDVAIESVLCERGHIAIEGSGTLKLAEVRGR